MGGWTSSGPESPNRYLVAAIDARDDVPARERIAWTQVSAAEPQGVLYGSGLSGDGSRLYATGAQVGGAATVAIDTETGERVWEDRYTAGGRGAWARSLAVGPGSPERVLVAGAATHEPFYGSGLDYVAVAYDGDSGDRAWTTRYDGRMGVGEGPKFVNEQAVAAGIAPDGSHGYMTGWSVAHDPLTCLDANGRVVCLPPAGPAAATVSLDMDDGEISWVARYALSSETLEHHIPQDLAVAPGGDVFVGGGVLFEHTDLLKGRPDGGDAFILAYEE